jgi:aspartyl-tRNA(Asn)/glutamyl-tRNA(Gln) amidotransferase subunit A
VSPVELVQACLRRIDERDPQLNAFITVSAESALEQATAAEALISQGLWRGPLHGIPIALKDIIDVAGIPTTAASRLFRDRVPGPGQDAEVVRRLREAGAVLIGKTNLHEFAYGGSSVISAYGPTRNPLAPDLTTGGSSGGAAAAVAAGMCYAAVGTDTAGSIRLPAAFCGVVGLKPSYGLVSARGVIPLAWTFDHVGPLARSATDAALLLQAIAGHDSANRGRRAFDPENYPAAVEQPVSHLRLGIPRRYFFDDLSPEIAASIEDAVERLASITAGVRDVEIPIDTDRTVHNAEAWQYHREYVERSPELYDPETLKRIRGGSGISGEDYASALRRVEELRVNALRVFNEVDVLVTPTVPVLPPAIAELTGDLDGLRAREMIMLRNTRPFNVLGWPALSTPCGFTAGLQLAAAPGKEATLFALAGAWERIFLIPEL